MSRRYAHRVTPAQVSAVAREVVAKRALILMAVAGGCHLLVAAGWMPGDISEGAEQVTTGVIDAVAAVGAIFWIRTGTTPADPTLQPKSTNGLPLVESHWDAGGHVRPVGARADLEQQLTEDPRGKEAL